ncbi:Friend virus susceptibility protein 1-like [Pipistrellus kuhlii]|uniref:Friend virus susceptibility protein 1-like n=1 Tax=Pipistrellus kuhlii TaxID=59472 RepID=UPI00174F4FC9|nr:Friend virus susceptibility protein 1-like [Pipistrellus kuhlii]XP_045437574.1 Friend virus susceptibility protein 1-like [Pipistrellus kuhlii]XP_045437575.1 Friend virus susceptibility protein 1-like [Pipistrellus kuhlii]XP_045437576.1 Friend virus susceptibility protein 1-like [Pipistrellus kuhlii]XP_045437577.1 Friend virus susceptibility protein 1-like [Pipistrellus kuhlii]
MAESTKGQAHHHYTYTELLAIAQHFRQEPEEHMVAWILRVYDQGGLALVLSFRELALLGNLTSDAIFNCLCRDRQWIGPTALLVWLLKAWRQRWPSFLHFEDPFRTWFTMEQAMPLVRQLGMLQWIYHEPAFEQAPCPAPEDMPFTRDMYQRLMALASNPQFQLQLADLPGNDMTVLEALVEIQKRSGQRPPASEPGVSQESTKIFLGHGVRLTTSRPVGLSPNFQSSGGWFGSM